MPSGIYKFENLINHKIYIGQSSDIWDRYKRHKRNIDDESHQEILYRAFRKYGFENFSFEIIESFDMYDKEQLDMLEQYYIKYYNSLKPNGYNMTPGGSIGVWVSQGKAVDQYDLFGNYIQSFYSAHEASRCSNINFSSICACCREEIQHTKNYQWKYSEDKRIIKNIFDSVPKTDYPIWQYDMQGKFIQEFENYNIAYTTLHLNPASLTDCLHGRNQSCGNYRWSYANQPILTTLNPHRGKKGRAVAQLSKNNEIIKVYSSAMEASRETGISNNGIGRACLGKAKSAGGYLWKFVDKIDIEK